MILPSSVKIHPIPFQSPAFSWQNLSNPERRASPGSRLFPKDAEALNGRGGSERQREQWQHPRASDSKETLKVGMLHLPPSTGGSSAPLLPSPVQELQLSGILRASGYQDTSNPEDWKRPLQSSSSTADHQVKSLITKSSHASCAG